MSGEGQTSLVSRLTGALFENLSENFLLVVAVWFIMCCNDYTRQGRPETCRDGWNF